MYPEQRETLDEIIVKIRSGRMKRRTFLERAIAVGLTSSAAVSLLEACGGSSEGGNGGTVNLVWQSEQDPTPTYKNLTESFNNGVGKQKGIHVTWQQGPSSTDEMLTRYTNLLRARSGSIDILSIDIVYPAQFGASQWTTPITDTQWPASERSNYLAGPIEGCTYQGKIWAAPLRTDLGLLYYRKDVVDSPPATWDDLTNAAKNGKVKYGYVWQGAQYEGLVCNFVEVVHGYGGRILDPNDATKVTVNSAEAKEALAKMVSWVGSVSPAAVTTYMEDPSRTVFQNGDSIFMRNWPYAYKLGNDTSQSKVANKFDIAALPHGGSSNVGHSAIGGWNLAINAYSKNPDAAWEFIKFMLGAEAQKSLAINATLTGVLKSVYQDQEVLSKQPLFGKLGPILENALPRPVSPKYTTVSDAIQRRVYSALKKNASVDDALSGLAADLQKIVAS